jgi:hypothetical protein
MIRRLALPAVLALILTAHIGSPNVVYDGTAGPYPVRVVVRPPSVVPGIAEVIVQVTANDVTGVNVRPVFWRAGVKGAPKGDDARRVTGQANLFTGQLWLMSRGSYSVYVTVAGARGAGTAIVPVTSFATGRLDLSPGLTASPVALGLFLFAGLVTISRAASGEALLEPGQPMDDAARRRARIASLVAVPLLSLVVLGGAKWWGAVDGDYERTMYRPPAMNTEVHGAQLDLRVRDTSAFRALFAPVIPDHGKMMHLFVTSAGTHEYFGHFHPVEVDSLHFRTALHGLAAGRYRLFGDVVLANGLSQTVSTTLDWPGDASAPASPDADDAWLEKSNAVEGRPGAMVPLGASTTLAWTSARAEYIAGQPGDLTFEARDLRGGLRSLQPYLGMAGHAVVLRDDESVFIHLHPMGTVATTAQQAFAARDRGDTTADGRIRLPETDMMGMPMPSASDGRLSFPYEFPKPGRYRIWVQVKPGQRVLTGAFDITVR